MSTNSLLLSNLLTHFGEFFAKSEVDKAILSDLTLICSDGQKFHTLRLIMASISPILKSLLLQNSDSDLIILPENVNYEALKTLHKCILTATTTTSTASENLETKILDSIKLMELLGITLEDHG
jgi:hypothetical protein